MLIYHPAFDAYHCAFRFLFLTQRLKRLELAKAQILDFYLCFPGELLEVRLPQDHGDVRSSARLARNPYRGPVSGRRTFRQMNAIQLAAIRMLAASGLFDSAALDQGQIVRTESRMPNALTARVAQAIDERDDVTQYIVDRMSMIPLTGPEGLKFRTGLGEYRYDPA